LERSTLSTPLQIGGDDRCHILAVVGGAIEIDGDPSGEAVPYGGTALLPAACGPVTLRPRGEAVVLDATLP
jgi:hypothetical protein